MKEYVAQVVMLFCLVMRSEAQHVQLKSNDAAASAIEISVDAACNAKTLEDMFDVVPAQDKSAHSRGVITLPNINSALLPLVVELLNSIEASKQQHIADADLQERLERRIEEFDAVTRVDILLAANYLDIPILIDACAAVIGRHLADYQLSIVERTEPSGERVVTLTSRLPAWELLPVELVCKILACASRAIQSTAVMLKTHTAHPLCTLQGHEGPVTTMAFSPDVRYLASGSDDGTVRIWEVMDGKQVQVLNHNAAINQLLYSPSGHSLATLSAASVVRIWNPETGNCLRTEVQDRPVRLLQYSKSGKYVGITLEDGLMRIYNPRTNIYSRPKSSINMLSVPKAKPGFAVARMRSGTLVCAAALGNNDIQVFECKPSADHILARYATLAPLIVQTLNDQNKPWWQFW